MDLRQIEYIVKIADESSITRAAEQLYISQSGLNQQLLKLEKELGMPLFHRSKNNLHLTEAGKVYVEYGRKILRLKQEAYNKINDIADNNLGGLSIGLTPERGTTMLLHIYEEFHKRFQAIMIAPAEIPVKKQISMLSKNYLDLGFLTLAEADKVSNLEYIHIKNENLLLGIPRSHPLAAGANPAYEPYAEIDLSLLRDEKFVLMTKTSTMRGIIDPLFAEAGFIPDILFETASNRTLFTMVKNKMGCTLIPETYAKSQQEVAYFLLPSRPQWEFVIAYNKGHYLSGSARYFIDLALAYWKHH